MGLPQDSSNCRMLGEWPFGGCFWMADDVVNDTIVYVNAGGSMYILNVKDPTNISKVGELQTPGIPIYFSAHDSLMCVSEFRAGVALYSIADVARPRLLGRCRGQFSSCRVTFDGRYAYVACFDSAVRVIDCQDPAHPNEIAKLLVPDGATVVKEQGSYLFIGAMCERHPNRRHLRSAEPFRGQFIHTFR